MIHVFIYRLSLHVYFVNQVNRTMVLKRFFGHSILRKKKKRNIAEPLKEQAAV